MNNRLIPISFLVLFLVGGLFVWYKKQSGMSPLVEPTVVESVPTVNEESIDTSDWQTYRNENYGFEFKYPKEWETKEIMGAEIGIPIDCQQYSNDKGCQHFSVRIFSPKVTDSRSGNVVLRLREKSTSEVAKSQFAKSTTNSKDVLVLPTTWSKKIGEQEIIKTSIDLPIYASCWVTVSIPKYSNLKQYTAYFESLYEFPDSIYSDEAEKYCAEEIPDPEFDHIVASFRSLL